MSAESGESQPSIEEILSSIREIIADSDNGTETASPHASVSRSETGDRTQTASQQGDPLGAAVERDLLNLLGKEFQAARADTPASDPNGVPPEPEPSGGAEDVLDLSEEFIVTEAAAAVRREQQQGAQADAPDPETSPVDNIPDAPPDSSMTTGEESGTAGGNEDNAAAHESSTRPEPETASWPDDFQMPVGREGPASPFTAAQTHPENFWRDDEQFDVTESYHRARTLSATGRFTRWEQETDTIDTQEQSDTAQTGESTQAQETRGAGTADATDDAASDGDAAGLELASRFRELTEDTPQEPSEVSDHRAGRPESAAQDAESDPAAEAEAAIDARPDAPSSPTPHHHEDEIDETAEHTEHNAETAHQDAPAAEPDDSSRRLEAEREHEPSTGHDAETVTPQTGEDTRSVINETAEHRPAMDEPPVSAETSAQARDMASAPAASAGSLGAKSLEESVKELLRPMLAEWLDKNMPRLVEAAMREQFMSSQPRDEHTPYAGATTDDAEDERSSGSG